MRTDPIDNGQDIIDSRDVIARIDELESERESAKLEEVLVATNSNLTNGAKSAKANTNLLKPSPKKPKVIAPTGDMARR